MPSARMTATVAAALAVLGFRSNGKEVWQYSATDEPTIDAQLAGGAVFLKSKAAKLSVRVARPMAEDFVPRLRKRLGSLRKHALRTARAQKQTSREALKGTGATLGAALAARRDSSDIAYSASARSYDPIAYCSEGKHFTRVSLMVSENQCGDCAGWPISGRRKS